MMGTAKGGLSRRTTLGLLALGATRPAWAASANAAADLRALLAASAAADAALDPLGEAGRRAPVFVDPLSDAYAAALEAAKRRELAGLAAIDRAALGATDRIAYDVLAFRAGQAIARFDSGLFAVARQVPLNPSFGLHVELPDFVAGAGAPFADLADYEAGLDRLTGFATHMDMTIERLREGLAVGRVQPRIIVDNVLAQVDAMLALPVEATPFYAAVTRLPAGTGESDRQQLVAAYRARIAGTVLPAYARWQTFLRDSYRPKAPEAPGRSAMPDGDRLYAAELAEHTTTAMTPAEIHALGLAEVARIRAGMEEARAGVGFPADLQAMFAYVRSDPRFYCKSQEELLDRFAAIEARIWPGMPKLFHQRPKAPFRVAPLPALGGQRGTGYYRPGPPDGMSPGTLFFNMAMLPTRPIPTLETLTLHEGIPGHHFQINLARENAALPDLLRFGSSTAYSEGWGLYAEQLGPDLGLFADPWQRFGHLDMGMLRAVRLVVDTGLHAFGWSRDRAIAYMTDNSSMAAHDIAVEIDRYIAQPGQACSYKIGEQSFLRLRREAQVRLGGRFDIRDFHAQCLDSGALPISVLAAKISDWIGGGGGTQA